MANNATLYGYMQLEDLYDRRVTEIGAERTDEAVRVSAAVYSADLDAAFALLVEDTTERDGAYELPISGELQPMSEDGTPVPTQGYMSVEQGYPLMRGADSFGLNRESYAKITARELETLQINKQSKDARWNFRRMLASVLTQGSYSFTEKGRTTLTVRGLATTADGAIYLDQNGDKATVEHYTAQSGDISNSANPYAANGAILDSHPANVGTKVSFIPPGLVDDTQALSSFYPYNAENGLVDFGADVDRAAAGLGQYIGFGKQVLGVVSENVIVLAPRMVAGYVMTVVVGANGKLLKRRQHAEPELQGFYPVMHQVDSNFTKWDFYRYAGFAVNNPIAAAVRQIGAGSYSIPTGYNAGTLPG